MSYLQFACQIFDAVSFRGQQYNQVVNQVGTFVYQTGICTVGSLDHCFHRLFAYFLRYLVDAGLKQAGGIRLLGHLFVTSVDEVLQQFEKHDRLFVLLAPASIGAGMAYRADRIYLNQQRVFVAIFFNRNNIQEITTLFAFGPQTVLGTAEKGYFPGFNSLLVSLFIHEAKHQHLAGVVVLYDGRNESVHFIKI